jgi:hypothetical protein
MQLNVQLLSEGPSRNSTADPGGLWPTTTAVLYSYRQAAVQAAAGPPVPRTAVAAVAAVMLKAGGLVRWGRGSTAAAAGAHRAATGRPRWCCMLLGEWQPPHRTGH